MIRSERANVARLRALLALGHLEADLLTLVEGLVALALDRGEVNEQVLATGVRGDEPVALVGVEPLDGTFWHGVSLRDRTTSGSSRCEERDTPNGCGSAQYTPLLVSAATRSSLWDAPVGLT